MSELQYHPAANIFPMMEREAFDSFVADIAKHGLREPIQLFGGAIIDGRNRYLACEKAGVEPRFVDIETDDPVAYVLSLNKERRHLTASQLAMVAGRARDYYDKQAKERQKLSEGRGKKGVVTLPHLNDEHGKSRDLAGKAVGVSGSLVDRATKVLENAVPELVAAVDGDRISVTNAAKLVDLPPDVQRTAAESTGKRGSRYKPVKIEEPEPEEVKPRKNGKPPVGVILANEALNVLMRIPKDDPLRKRGFQIVADWIRTNK